MTEDTDVFRELKREKIARLWKAGVPTDEIMLQTGCTRKSVHTTVSNLRKAGVALPMRHGQSPIRAMNLRPEALQLASQEAGRRGITLAELATRILLTVITEKMISAVLDDVETP